MLCRQTDRQEVRQTHTHTRICSYRVFIWSLAQEYGTSSFWKAGDVQLWIDKAGQYTSFNWQRWNCSWNNEMIVMLLTSVYCSNRLSRFYPCIGAVSVWKPFGSHHLFQIYPLCPTVLFAPVDHCKGRHVVLKVQRIRALIATLLFPSPHEFSVNFMTVLTVLFLSFPPSLKGGSIWAWMHRKIFFQSWRDIVLLCKDTHPSLPSGYQ